MYLIFIYLLDSGCSVAQAVRRSPPTAGVASSRLGHSMWVSWWTKWSLGRYSSGFSHKFHYSISPYSSHSFHFNKLVPVMVLQEWSAGIPVIHRPSINGLHRFSSQHPALCRTGVGDFFCLVGLRPSGLLFPYTKVNERYGNTYFLAFISQYQSLILEKFITRPITFKMTDKRERIFMY